MARRDSIEDTTEQTLLKLARGHTLRIGQTDRLKFLSPKKVDRSNTKSRVAKVPVDFKTSARGGGMADSRSRALPHLEFPRPKRLKAE